MADREWYEVVRGSALLSGLGAQLNEDGANFLAESLAQDSDEPVCVVRLRRTDVRSYQRQVTVSSQDMTTSLGAT